MSAHTQHAELPPELSIVLLYPLDSPDYLDGYLRPSMLPKVHIARPSPSNLVLDTEGVGHARKRIVAVLRGAIGDDGAICLHKKTRQLTTSSPDFDEFLHPDSILFCFGCTTAMLLFLLLCACLPTATLSNSGLLSPISRFLLTLPEAYPSQIGPFTDASDAEISTLNKQLKSKEGGVGGIAAKLVRSGGRGSRYVKDGNKHGNKDAQVKWRFWTTFLTTFSTTPFGVITESRGD